MVAPDRNRHIVPAESMLIMAFLAVAWYNVIELIVLTYAFFKRRSGLYFWSFMVTTVSIFMYTMGNLLGYYRIGEYRPILSDTIRCTGWVGMCISQSLILYSRLHLLVQGSWVKWVLVAIIADAFFTMTPVLAAYYYVTIRPEDQVATAKVVYDVCEKIQVTVFFLQETVLAGIYIYRAMTLLKTEGPIWEKAGVRGDKPRRVLMHTLGMSLVLVCLDLGVVIFEFVGLLNVQTSFKCAVYAVKAKMEFIILNQLLKLVKSRLKVHPDGIAIPALSLSSHPQSNSGGGTLKDVAANRLSSLRSRTGIKEMGNSAGAYAKMNEGGHGVPLKDFYAERVLKTTEVKVEREGPVMAGDVESQGSFKSDAQRRSVSRSSSDIQIIEYAGRP